MKHWLEVSFGGGVKWLLQAEWDIARLLHRGEKEIFYFMELNNIPEQFSPWTGFLVNPSWHSRQDNPSSHSLQSAGQAIDECKTKRHANICTIET